MTDVVEKPREFLPFYVNGTLDADENSAVERALIEQEDLRDEIADLQALRQEMQDLDAGPSAGEFVHARLMRDIDQITQDQPDQDQRAFGNRRLVAWLAVAAAFAVLGLGLTNHKFHETIHSEYNQAAGADFDGTLTVRFNPDITLSELNTLIVENNLNIVDGPSAAGLYQLHSFDGSDLGVVAQRLGAETDLVVYIE